MYRAESRVEHGSIHAFPFKKGEGMRKGRMFFIDTQTRKISPLGGLAPFSVEMTKSIPLPVILEISTISFVGSKEIVRIKSLHNPSGGGIG